MIEQNTNTSCTSATTTSSASSDRTCSTITSKTKTYGIQKITLPEEEGKFVSFKSIEKQLPVPVIIYADFESFTTKIQKCKNPSSSTDPYELHVPSGYSFYIVSSHPKFKPVL